VLTASFKCALFTQIIDDALNEEFKEEEGKKEETGQVFNETHRGAEVGGRDSAACCCCRYPYCASLCHACCLMSVPFPLPGHQATEETVIIIKGDKGAANETESNNTTQSGTMGSGRESGGNGTEARDKHKMGVETDVDRIIDSHDNEYVLSRPNE
jgi:hypothetical protein